MVILMTNVCMKHLKQVVCGISVGMVSLTLDDIEKLNQGRGASNGLYLSNCVFYVPAFVPERFVNFL